MPPNKYLMRYHELTETPLASYDLHGDFTQTGSIRAKDRKLVSSSKHPERLERLLRAGTVPIAVHIINLSQEHLIGRGYDTADDADGGDHLRSLETIRNDLHIEGVYTSAELKKLFGVTIRANPEAINGVIPANTNGSDALSAWMIIHRICHMVDEAVSTAGSAKFTKRTPRVPKELADAWQMFTMIIYQLSYRDLAQIVTMKSAPVNSEVVMELFTQFLVKGRVTLKHIDAGRITAAQAAQLEDQFNQLLGIVAQQMIGKIFIGF